MRLVLLILFHSIFLSTLSQDTLKVTYYNLLNFPSSQQDRIDTLVKILDFIKPDIFVDDESDDFKIDTKTDDQLNYALKLLTT